MLRPGIGEACPEGESSESCSVRTEIDPVDLNTIREVRPATGQLDWREGDSWLAGGTWLFSEPQPALRRLVDLGPLGWEPLIVNDGLRIAATCTIAQLDGLVAPSEWTAAPLIRECCRALLASFKVWNAATVGGNICMSLPAGAMISLTAALEGTCLVRSLDGAERGVAVTDFVTGDHRNVLGQGDLLVAIELPRSALRKRTSFRRMSLTKLGRSSVLLIGTIDPADGIFLLTITASTVRPIQLRFGTPPDRKELDERLRAAIPDAVYHNDVHGSSAYRKHLTHHFAQEIRRDLATVAPA
jgi:CO/xanthine dehydrogenase FAD-binding subunit